MLSPGYYATTLEHVTGAQQLLDKAQSLNVEDTEIKSALDTLQQDIDRMSKRRFAGNWKAAAIAAGIGFLMLNGRETANMGLFVLVGSALYIGSAFIPQYIVNRHLLRGKPFNDFGWASRVLDWGRQFDNVISHALSLGFVFMVYTMVLPFLGVYNLYRYHGDSIRRWFTSPQNRQRMSTVMGELQSATHKTVRAAGDAVNEIKTKVRESRATEGGPSDTSGAREDGGPASHTRSGLTRANVTSSGAEVGAPPHANDAREAGSSALPPRSGPTRASVPTSPAAAVQISSDDGDRAPSERRTTSSVDPAHSTASVRRMGRPAVSVALAIVVVAGIAGGGFWAWNEKQKAELLARQQEEVRIAEAKRVEEEAARREQELRQKLKEEEDRRQKAEQDRLAAEARAAEEARVRRQAEVRAAEEANARRQAEAAAIAAARAREDAQRAAQARDDAQRAAQKGAKDARAAAPGSRVSTGYQVASSAAARGDYTGAQTACLGPAQAGDAHCQFLIGVLYAKRQVGSGNASDMRTAADWFRQSAQQNVAPAQFNLGLMYERGAGVPRDLNAARMWYQRAAAQGDKNAFLALGRLGTAR